LNNVKHKPMKWTTPITIKEAKGYLHHGSPILSVGSCFADHVADYLSKAKFDIVQNPFGTLYNPESIAMALQRLMSGTPYTQEELSKSGNLWYSYHHHGKFSQTSADATLQHINKAFTEGAEILPRCERLIITFGTSYVYRLASNGMTVANCHKQPATLFTRTRLQVDEIVSLWEPLLQQIGQYAPSCKVLFTVSPIRHLSDGAHENQLSKSTLLLAIDALCKCYSDMCNYFPAYEIVLDELRDYRFYAEDMAHPSAQAIAYVCQRLADSYFTDTTCTIAEECLKINRSMQHRPLNGTDNDNYRKFLNSLIDKMQQIAERYPVVSFQQEIEIVKQKLLQ